MITLINFWYHYSPLNHTFNLLGNRILCLSLICLYIYSKAGYKVQRKDSFRTSLEQELLINLIYKALAGFRISIYWGEHCQEA